MTPLKKYVRRYTSISATIDTLTRKRLSLLDPQNWDDRNDRYFMKLYKEREKVSALYALCASRSAETYHHWRVFTGTADGACIEIDRGLLEVNLQKLPGVRFENMKYLKLEELEALPATEINRLPFLKRHAFRHEFEYRIIAARNGRQQAAYPIKIEIDWINCVWLNPWIPDQLAESVTEALKSIEGRDAIDIRKSRLIESSRWKSAGDALVVKATSAPRKITKPKAPISHISRGVLKKNAPLRKRPSPPRSGLKPRSH